MLTRVRIEIKGSWREIEQQFRHHEAHPYFKQVNERKDSFEKKCCLFKKVLGNGTTYFLFPIITE